MIFAPKPPQINPNEMTPAAPVTPSAPTAPFSFADIPVPPTTPETPVAPIAPVAPVAPVTPAAPMTPPAAPTFQQPRPHTSSWSDLPSVPDLSSLPDLPDTPEPTAINPNQTIAPTPILHPDENLQPSPVAPATPMAPVETTPPLQSTTPVIPTAPIAPIESVAPIAPATPMTPVETVTPLISPEPVQSISPFAPPSAQPSQPMPEPEPISENIFSLSTPPPEFDAETPLLDDPVFGLNDAVFEETDAEAIDPMDVMPEYESPAPVMDMAKQASSFAPPTDYHKPESSKKNGAANPTYIEPHIEKTEKGKVLRARSLVDVPFADIWFTPENIAYVRDEDTKFALIPIETEDLSEFRKNLEEGFTGSSSYALKFEGESYRVERIVTITGVQYNCRKMPTETPDIYSLGLPKATIDYLVGLSQEAGLILLGGPTGMGKTTTACALLHKYLQKDGGFMYTVEDPPEMPLDGLYQAQNGGLGLCKQTPVENERWEEGLKSALRSRPRYILVGEIRTPEVASQVLRAATSGHLVLSTIHANSVEDSLNALIKYATGSGLAESLVTDLLARGILAVVHQKLEGTRHLRPIIHSCFANPNPLAADQMRMAIREGKINLATLMEAQATKLLQGKPLYREL